jgi:hydrogenase nickel incorporation protein HypB
MCQDCGCSTPGEIQIHSHDSENHHHHHHHDAPSPETQGRTFVTIAESVLSKNERLAERNRGYFQAKNLLTLNLLSSPGSGKTALIEKTILDLLNNLRVGVIVGDLATDNDARRLRKSGATAVQITTGTTCHLEAEMVAKAAQQLNLDEIELLIIENVGNLVCPAAFDLGESLRVVMLSVTEGEDKPLKYPATFKSADAIIISKIDIAEAVGFQREIALDNIHRIAPQADIFEVSARTGWGMEQWYRYLETRYSNSLRQF